MGSVICVAKCSKMESNTFSAILFLMKTTTTKSSRNLTTRVGAEPLRDIFLRKTGNHYFYFPGPLDEQNNTNMAVASRFSVWAKKRRNRTDITKKIRSVNAL